MSVGRGRPPKYVGKQLTEIKRLIRQYGRKGAQAILNANTRSKAGKELVEQRNTDVVPKPLGISLPTLGSIAKGAGIQLQKGRPSASTGRHPVVGKVTKEAA